MDYYARGMSELIQEIKDLNLMVNHHKEEVKLCKKALKTVRGKLSKFRQQIVPGQIATAILRLIHLDGLTDGEVIDEIDTIMNRIQIVNRSGHSFTEHMLKVELQRIIDKHELQSEPNIDLLLNYFF